MPHDKAGSPYEVLLNPLGVISRCYDEQTEFLTDRGWVFGRDVHQDDQFVCYHVWTENLYTMPQLEKFHVADYTGKMLKFENKLMDFCVTPNHRMWAACGYPGAPWQEVTAERIFDRNGWKVPVAGNPVPGEDRDFVLPQIERHVKDTQSSVEEIVIEAGDWAEFLGWYVAEGNADEKVHISQSIEANPENCSRIEELLNRLPFAWNYNAKNTQFHITSKRLCEHLKPLGLCDEKHVPDWVFSQSPETRQRFLDSYLAGDGDKDQTNRDHAYWGAGTTSKQLAQDLQRLLIYQGYSANTSKQPSGMWRVGIHAKRHRILEKQNWAEVDYDGKIYCPTVPTGYIVTRRNGKVLIAGNTNPAQMVEAALGKLAKHRGQPIKVEDFDENIEDMTEWARDQLRKAGLSDTEDIVDPSTDKKIKGINTGNRFFMKLHHTAECFDDQTEVLTKRGWVSWVDARDDDEFATLDGGDLVYEQAERVVRSEYYGQLCCFEGRYLDYAVTPNHRLWLKSYNWQKEWGFREAGEVHGRRFSVQQFGPSAAGNNPATTKIGDDDVDWDDYAELVGWWVTEGYAKVTRRRACVMIYQSESANPEKLARIEELVARLPWPWHYYKVKGEIFGVGISSRALAEHLKQYGTHSHNKRLPRHLLEGGLTGRQRLFASMMDGDGNRQTTPTGNMERFTTTSKGLADDFQELCVRSGFGAVIRPVKPRKETHYLPAWTCGVALSRTTAQIDGDRNLGGFSLRMYKGVVYCATMRTGMLYVRRNGKPMWSGNSKGQGRGSGGYTAEDAPAKGGETGSKRIALLDVNALLSHGATEVLRDASAIRGQKNEDYWLQFMQGYTPKQPKVPLVYEKFVNELKGAGINVVRDGTQTNIMALTDDDIDQLAGDRTIKSGETVHFDKDLKPIPGGLFDPAVTGGHHGRRWAAIKLAEPMPNPVMEEPIRRVLGLTGKKFQDIIAGKDTLPRYGTGLRAISEALENINLDREILRTQGEIKNGTKAARDAAVRRLGYLKSAKRLNIHPRQWMLKKAPVLPPQFRPVSVMTDKEIPLVADPNFLYKELIEANNNLIDMKGAVGDEVGDERLAVYNAFKAVTGLGDPITQESKEKNVRGILKSVFGSSPKFGTAQRKLIGTTVDNVGRAVITPNPSLDMDSVGLPEDRAFEVYKRFLVRRLKRKGMPVAQAMRHVNEKSSLARDVLIEEMEQRPVIINRAPVLHRFGIMAFKPRLVKGSTLQVSPLVVKGFNADFDGDAMNYHVPTDEEARKEALDRMLPSRQLLSPSDFKSPVHAPSQEYVGGLYHATASKSERPVRTFASQKDAIAAYRRGEISIDDQVQIIG